MDISPGPPSPYEDVTNAPAHATVPGLTFDSFRLIRQVGEGGMGEVWLAEQCRPIRRQVAIKIIKAGMDTAHVVARFNAERQALALMNHPAIATVFDAGATPQGRPYFAMEYVPGLAITEYCDEYRLTTRERLELFIPICDAVQHAHQKGIIHRDLKPSNVLVGLQNGKAVPKVIDFGLVKVTGQRLVEHTIFTRQGVLLGTPVYMSPEQAEMSTLDIDTLTDIYSLGVILYELLVGIPPFDSAMLERAGYEGIRRILTTKDPPTLTNRLESLGDTAGEVARRRRTTAVSLQKELRGDLEWITLKALEKDRTRRYASASELAADVRRYLSQEPIAARPPSLLYHVGKFVRRHKTPVAFAVSFFVLLAVFAVAMTIQVARVSRERERANREAEVGRQISAFMEGLFEIADPNAARGSSVTARELLDKGVREIQVELKTQPVVQARLMNTMGKVYTSLGLYAQVESILTEALKLRRHAYGEEHPEVAESLHNLAALYVAQGKYSQAEQLYRRALAIREKAIGLEHPDLAQTLHSLGVLYSRQGKYEQAEAFLQRGLAIREKVLGPEHTDVGLSLSGLGAVYNRLGKYQQAESFLRRAVAILQRAAGPEDRYLARSLEDLAFVYWREGKYDQAEPFYRHALAINEKVLGLDHPDVAAILNNLGLVYFEQGKYKQAEPFYNRAVAVWEKALGPEHPNVAESVNGLGNVYSRQGKYEQAEPLFQRALAIREKAFGPQHTDVAWTLTRLGELYSRQRKYDMARRLLERAFAIFENALGSQHPALAHALHGLGNVYRDQGRYVDAEPFYQRAVGLRETRLGRDHPDLVDTFEDYARLLRKTGRSSEAIKLESRANTIRSRQVQ